MPQHLAESAAISFFCDSVSVMLAAGIQTDEAVHMLVEDMEDTSFRKTCTQIYRSLVAGESLAESMVKTGAFPAYATDMVAVGERSGKLENVLRSLGVYYSEEARMFEKIKSAIGYPAALFCIMSVILIFTIAVILPVFVNVYESLSGSLSSGAFDYVGVSIGIGWFALIVTLIATIIALIGVVWSRSPRGRLRLMRVCEKVPGMRHAMYQLALSRFISALAAYIGAGMNTDDAMRESLLTVDHMKLAQKVGRAYSLMTDLDDPRSLSQALDETSIIEPIYIRMLTIGTRAGTLDMVLTRLSDMFFDDALTEIDRSVDSIEPALAAFLTIAVGATLIAVMLPLIGIMGSIG